MHPLIPSYCCVNIGRQITDFCCFDLVSWVADVCEVKIFLACISCACSRKTRVIWRQNYWSRGAIGRSSRRDGHQSSASCSCCDGRRRVAARGRTKACFDAPVSRSKSTPPGDGDSRSRQRISTAVLRGAREASNFHY